VDNQAVLSAMNAKLQGVNNELAQVCGRSLIAHALQ
jgi:hypothetical protein